MLNKKKNHLIWILQNQFTSDYNTVFNLPFVLDSGSETKTVDIESAAQGLTSFQLSTFKAKKMNT